MSSPPSDSLPQGAEVSARGVIYSTWARSVSAVSVEITPVDQGTARMLGLTLEKDGYFRVIDSAGRAGDRYLFRLGETGRFPDPASRWQPEGVHGPSMVIDPETYRWCDAGWQRPAFRDLVIYEMHIGTFTPEGTFRAAIAKLPHLRDLGVNALELMPIGDFAGSRNWGYDGVYLFAPARVYGQPDDLRALVEAAHDLGLAILLDVVYNHFGPDGNYLHMYAGEYLNEADKTPWGGAIRYGEPEFLPLRQLVVSNPAYWMREFHVDGFRFDATHAIFDHSSRHILQELTASVRNRGGYAIAEDPRNDACLVHAETEGGYGFDAVWADDFHHIMRVAHTHEQESYFADFAGELREAVNALSHGWLYRGQFSKVSGQTRGTACAHLPPERFVHCLSNHDQTGNHAFGERISHRIHPAALRAAEALLCLTPYTPMLFMGQEWAASSPFLFFTDHQPELGKLIIEGRRDEFKHFAAFNAPEVLEKIPSPQAVSSFESSKLVWSERENDRHSGALALYTACLAVRAEHAAFRPLNRDSWRVEELAIGVGALRLESDKHHWLVIFDPHGGHAGSVQDEAILALADGSWEVVLSSNESRFGGAGTCGFDPASMMANFVEPETVVLRSV